MKNEHSLGVNYLLAADTHALPIRGIDPRGNNVESLNGIIHLGDFSDFGTRAAVFFDQWKDLGVPIYFVSGNHEKRELCREIETKYGAVCLDYEWRMDGRVLFVGLAGYDIFAADRKQSILRFRTKLRESGVMNGSHFTILMTHESPWPWKYAGKVRGDTDIAELVCEFRFDLVLTGHLHEKKSRLEREGMSAPTLNPGAGGCVLKVDLEHEIITNSLASVPSVYFTYISVDEVSGRLETG